ncbi:hypothetical protein SUGI_0282830 [Cryptomeria japonica]|nr:hypothetical protein SUGI_0282830 [Cryptomeria japonica]
MTSSSSSQQQNQEFNVFSGIETTSIRRSACESSRLFNVFINHRGPDVKQTLDIEQLGIWAFLDSEEKELGNSFLCILRIAIRSAYVHIAFQRICRVPLVPG